MHVPDTKYFHEIKFGHFFDYLEAIPRPALSIIYQNLLSLVTLVSIVTDRARGLHLFQISFQVFLPSDQRKRTARRRSFRAQVPDGLSTARPCGCHGGSPFHSPRFANMTWQDSKGQPAGQPL